MDFLVIKALHIIFVVTWFAGLFYIVRLFIYHTEAEDKSEDVKNILQEQYKIMSKRLWYIITWPSAILTLVLGTSLIVTNPSYLHMPWMHVKIALLILLYGYHYYCHRIFQQLQNDIVKHTSNKLRLVNEVATLLLFAIVFLVVLKNAINWIYALLGIIALGGLLMILIKVYRRYRNKPD